MKFKVLCSDLDGTLLSTKSDVSDFAIAEISRIKDSLKVILVSARMPKAITYLQERLGIMNEPMICYNGALIINGALNIFSTVIQIKHLESINEIAQKHEVKLGLYHGNEWYASENTDFIQKEIIYTRTTPIFRPTRDTVIDWKLRKLGAHKIMLMGTKKALDSMHIELQKELKSELLLYRSNDVLIEVAPAATSKLLGIQKILGKRQTLNDVIAFGDNYNDIEMLRAAGCGVAVGNAQPEVKAVADKITLRNTDDGVAHFINQHL